MKTLKLNLLVILMLAFISGCGKNDDKTSESKSTDQNTEANADNEKKNESAAANSETVIIDLPTIQCNMCKKSIESAVKKIDGVNEVVVEVKDKVAKINYVKSKTDLNTIEGAIVMTGYQANDLQANKEAYDELDECCKIGGHK